MDLPLSHITSVIHAQAWTTRCHCTVSECSDPTSGTLIYCHTVDDWFRHARSPDSSTATLFTSQFRKPWDMCIRTDHMSPTMPYMHACDRECLLPCVIRDRASSVSSPNQSQTLSPTSHLHAPWDASSPAAAVATRAHWLTAAHPSPEPEEGVGMRCRPGERCSRRPATHPPRAAPRHLAPLETHPELLAWGTRSCC